MPSKSSLLISIVFALSIFSCKEEIHSIAFYNVENLFDTLDNPHANDNEFLPASDKNWDTEKYRNKIDSLAKVISLIGDEDGPEVLGLCEVENKKVVEDLSKAKSIREYDYQIAHIESNDYRGIDVALIYKKEYSLDTMQALKVEIEDEPRFRTRDILYAQLRDKKNRIYHFYINHWPSRIGGTEKTDYKRMAASMTLKNHLQELLRLEADANVFIMGDFNDESTDESIGNLMELNMFNTHYALDSSGRGTYCYRGDWNMLDQILISPALRDGRMPDYVKGSAGIYDREWLRQKGENNRYRGYPLRTWGGRLYLGGFSDHLPVFIRIRN